MNTVKTVLGLAMLAAIPASAAAAPGRVLLEDPAFHATVSSAMDCSAPVDLMLITPDPALLDSDTNDVQRVVDASLAAIRFQCPDLDRLTVHGSLQATVSHLKRLTALDISFYEPRPAGITEQSFRY